MEPVRERKMGTRSSTHTKRDKKREQRFVNCFSEKGEEKGRIKW